MRIAVTGGDGFIGRRVCARLEQEGHEAITLDKSTGVDIRDRWAQTAVASADGVIHLAGILGTDELFDEPEEAVDVNIKGTINVLKGCAKAGIPYVGITMPQVWDNVYQATKNCAMRLASAWHRHYDVPVSHVRAYNVFGPGQKVGRPQKIVPTFANAAWQDQPIPVWGDGEQLVDLVYVDDVAHMLVDALMFGDNRVFDCGTGHPLTVNRVAELIIEMIGSNSGIEHKPMRRGEHGKGVMSEGENQHLLGWKPEFRIPDLVNTIDSYQPVVIG